MPQLPILNNRANLPEFRYQRAQPENFGAGAFEQVYKIGTALEHLQDGADKAEAARLAAETKAKFDESIGLNKREISDPQEFLTKTEDAIKSHHDTALAAATNTRVKNLYQAAIGDNLIKARSTLRFDHYDKVKDLTLANARISLDSYKRDLIIEEDPQKSKETQEKIGQLVGSLKANGFWSYESSVKEISQLNNDVMVGRVREQIRKGNFGIAQDIMKDPSFPIQAIDPVLAHLNASYRQNTVELEKAEKKKQEDEMRRILPLARTSQITPEEIDAKFARGEISESQWKEAQGTRRAAGRAGEVTESDPLEYKRLFASVHQGGSMSFDAVNRAAAAGLISDKDWASLTADIEANRRRSQDKLDERKEDKQMKNDPLYQSAQSYIQTLIPVHDQLTLDQKFKRAEAMRTFHEAAFSGSFKREQLAGLAETIVERVLSSDEMISVHRSRIRPGIDLSKGNTPNEKFENSNRQIVALLQRGEIGRAEAVEQAKTLEKLNQLGYFSVKSKPGTSSKEKAQQLTK